jgi:hypothetical protein
MEMKGYEQSDVAEHEVFMSTIRHCSPSYGCQQIGKSYDLKAASTLASTRRAPRYARDRMPFFPPRLRWLGSTSNYPRAAGHVRTKLKGAIFGVTQEQRRQRVLDLFKEPPRPVGPPQGASWDRAGLRAPLIDALHRAFPNVEGPTKLQRQFIPAVNEGLDVMLKDATGTGKYVAHLGQRKAYIHCWLNRSFGLLLALLNKPRIGVQDRERHDEGAKSPVNILFIV